MNDDRLRRILQTAQEPLAPAPHYVGDLLAGLKVEAGFPGSERRATTLRPRGRSWGRRRYWLLLAAVLATSAVGMIAGAGSLRRESAVADPLLAPVRSFSWGSTGLAVPLDMAAGPDRLLYVLDVKPSVTVIDPADGRVLRSWGRQGSDAGAFNLTLPDDPGNPGRGSIDVGTDGRVFVADSGNHRIEVFDADGRYLEAVGGQRTADGPFGQLDELVVGRDGSVYVLDLSVNRITKLAPDGRFSWRSQATSANPLDGHWIHGLAVRDDGTLIATCEGCTQFLVFDQRDGHLVRRLDPIGFTGRFSGPIELDAAGNTVIELYTEESFKVFDPAGHLLSSMSLTGKQQRVDSVGRGISYGDWYYPTPVFLADGRAFTFDRDGLVEPGWAGRAERDDRPALIGMRSRDRWPLARVTALVERVAAAVRPGAVLESRLGELGMTFRDSPRNELNARRRFIGRGRMPRSV